MLGAVAAVILLGVPVDPPMNDTGVIQAPQDAMVDVLILSDGGMLVRPGDPNDPPPMRIHSNLHHVRRHSAGTVRTHAGGRTKSRFLRCLRCQRAACPRWCHLFQ